MNKQDSNGVRTAQDLEKKYDFASLLGLKKNIEIMDKSIMRVNNELNNILNTLIINLKDVLDDQGDVSLWFYDGTPTTKNEPYTTWTNPDGHIGDIYYDQDTGYVYQYYSTGWKLNDDVNLVSAMALTNVELDVTTDHERKVFFTQPIPPYSSGDWWIQDDGILYICQIGKIDGEYEENDFVTSNKYTSTIATKIGNDLTVLQGTVTTITNDYVKFTDLSTNGSTTIAGENISTGSIKSNNYIENNTGMKIDLSNGTINSKNFKTDTSGNVFLGTGAKVIGGDGLMTNLQYTSFIRELGQQEFSNEGLSIYRSTLEINVVIPSNFVVSSAKVEVKLFKTMNCYIFPSSPTVYCNNYGKVQNIRLYKAEISSEYTNGMLGTFERSGSNIELDGAFGTDGYTATTIEESSFSSIDIKDKLNDTGTTTLIIQTGDDALNVEVLENVEAASRQTQVAYAIVNIEGYKSYDEEGE